jgi:GNAT superfamily N-acetyltransferase
MTSNKYQIRSYDSAAQFLRDADEFLTAHEDTYNSLCTVAMGARDSRESFSPPFWYGTVTEGNSAILACAVHASPDGLISSDLDSGSASLIVESVVSALGWPKRISGTPSAVLLLADRFEFMGAPEYDSHKEWTIYRIDSAPPQTSTAEGFLRNATEHDEHLVREWGRLYDAEKPAFTSIETFFARKLERNELFLWEKDGARTALAMSGKTRSGIRISAVYTPQESRGMGFASAATAEATRRAISDGFRFVTLHAQTADPVERMYQRLGYVEIGRYFSASTVGNNF